MRDTIARPPVRREFVSANGKFEFTVSSVDNWKTFAAVGTLASRGAGEQHPLWQHPIANRQGPRRAMVSNEGAVVLVDDWLNTPSPQALTLINASGATVAIYSLDSLITALRVPRRSISEHAVIGIWLSREPEFTSDGQRMVFHTAGKLLTLDLASGRILASAS